MRTTSDPDFAAVSAVCALLSSLTVPYWIIGGWAIDLAVGRVTRDHADVDVMMLERDKHALWSDLTGVDVESRQAPWGPGASSCTATSSRCPLTSSCPGRPGCPWSTAAARIASRGPWPDITRYRDSIPYLAPEVVLLFKARSKAARDQHDVETALPLLDAGQRSWLHDALKLLPQGKPASVPHG